MGPIEKEDSNESEISLNKNVNIYKRKSRDNSFQTVENVSEKQKKMQDDYLERPVVKENVETAEETIDKHAEVSERKKKRKCKSSNLEMNENVSEKQKEMQEDFIEGPPVKENVENTGGTTDDHGEVSERKIKRKSKRSNLLKNNDLEQNLVEESTNKLARKNSSTLGQNTKATSEVMDKPNQIEVDATPCENADQTLERNAREKTFESEKKKKKMKFSESNDNDSDGRRKSQEVLPCDYVVEVDKIGISKSETDSMIKNDSLATSLSVEESAPMKHPRKKKKLFDSSSNHLSPNKDAVPNSSLNVQQNSSKEDDMLALVESKERVKTSNLSCDSNLNWDGIVTTENDFGKTKSAKVDNLKEPVKGDVYLTENDNGRRTSPRAVENVATGESSTHFSNKKPRPRRRNRVKGKHSLDESKTSTSPVYNSPKQPEHVMENTSSECEKEETISLSLTKRNIKYDLIEKDVSPVKISTAEGCNSLIVATEEFPFKKKYANLASASSRWRRRYIRGIANRTAYGDVAYEVPSVHYRPTKQLQSGDLEADAFHVCEENLKLSSNVCQMEAKTSQNEDAPGDAVVLEIPNNQDNLGRTLHASPIGASITCKRKKLLVLDLNGLLADIVSDPPPGYTPDTYISVKALFKRPFCDDFLKFCFANFNVGVWSSRTKRNVTSVLDFIMGDMKQHLLFSWHQSHCTDTGFNTLENSQKPLVLKELSKLWNKQEDFLPWEKGEYNESNTLLLDDSPYKALRNPPHTAIFPPPYEYKNKDDNSLGPGGDLRVYLEGLLEAENVQNYVEKHPFGQRAITSKSASWSFYLRIIGKHKTRMRGNNNNSSNQYRMRTAR